MSQNVNNLDTVENQLNIDKNSGPINLYKKTRFARRFEKLNEEVINDSRYDGIIESLEYYLTELDGLDMPTKLKDGGFSENEIISASRSKANYWKKLEKNKYYESAQWIDNQLFAKIKMNFNVYIKPAINNNKSKDEIIALVTEKVVIPVVELINIEGENDEVLNYDMEDIFGMIYYLTGKCHINWRNYDSI